MILRDLLLQEGHVAQSSPDAASALPLFRAHRPDLVLAGVEARRVDGWAALDAIRAEDPHASIIALGSVGTDEARKRAARSGCLDYVSKELGFEAFLFTLKQVIGRVLPSDAPAARPRGRILVVDDEAAIRGVLERFLKGKGFDVVTAADGETALALVKRERPHLMLLDVDMPGMSGLEVLKLLRQVDKEVGVIMVTGNTDPDTAEWTMTQGASDYIVKPLNFQYLETTVMTKLLLLTR